MKVYRSEETVSTRVDITDHLEYYENSKTFGISSINISIDAVERQSYVDIHFNYLDMLNLYDSFQHEIENNEYFFTQLKGYPNKKINYILNQVRNIYLINENYLIERGYKSIYDIYVKESWSDKGGIEYYLSKMKKYFFYNESYSSNKEKTLMLHKIIYGNVADIAIKVFGDGDGNYDGSSLCSFVKSQIQKLASKFLITPNSPYAQINIKLSDYVESKKNNNLHFKSLNRLLKIDFENKTQIELKKLLRKNMNFTLFNPNDDLLRL